MNNEMHVRWSVKLRPAIFDLPFNQNFSTVVKEVSADKDSRKYKGFGLMHRVRGHGRFSNIPYLFKYGIRGLRAGRMHDRQDILWSFGNPLRTKTEILLDLVHIRRERRRLRIRERRLIL